MKDWQRRRIRRISVCSFLSWIGLSGPAFSRDPVGGLRGIVRDAYLGAPVPAATVQIVERDLRVNTGDDGRFFFSDLPSGAFTLMVSKAGYHRALRPGVEIRSGQMTELDILLTGEVTEMDELVVRDIVVTDTATEVGLLTLRAGSVAIQDAISGELLRRAGAGDAAGALKLVVGASIEDGKYATVRGLSDRYVGATLNNIRIPSADPKRRAVHMDLFPAGTIQSVSVSKTFTPNLPGDFSGGGVNIETIGIPDEPFLRLSFSRGTDSLTTGRSDFLGYDGPPMDPWGRHRGARDMPEGASTMKERDAGLISHHQRLADDRHPHSDLYLTHDRLTRSFAPAMGTRRERAGPNWSAGISGGDRGQIADGVWGWIGALHYGHKYEAARGDGLRRVVPPLGSAPESPMIYRREVGTEELRYSKMAAIGVGDGEEQQVSVLGLRNRVATDRAALRQRAFDPSVENEKWLEQAIHYSERSLDALQWRGRHVLFSPRDGLFGLNVDWFAARHLTEQEEPDVRFFRNVVTRTPSGWLHTQRPAGASGIAQDYSTRNWRNTQEENSQLGLDIELPFEFSETEAEGRLKFGFSRDWTRREYTQNSFYYLFAGQQNPVAFGMPERHQFPPGGAGRRAFMAARAAWEAGPAGVRYRQAMADAARSREKEYYLTATPDPLWTDVFTHPDRIGVGSYQDSMYWQVLPREYDVGYSGVQNFPAGYAMLEFPITGRLTLMVGGRAENTEMSIDPRSDSDYLVLDRIPVATNQAGQVIYQYGIASVPWEQATLAMQDSRWLPSTSLIYEPAPGMKLRGSWSRTIARPTFLEIAPIITFDYIEGETFVGNRDLRLTQVTNYDVRWEWIRPEGEVYALSWFHKDMLDPIETESFSYLVRDYLLAYNYPEGSVHGIEAEFRRSLNFLPWPWKNLALNVNYTRMEARVTVPDQMRVSLAHHGIEREERAMEGQPEYLFNAGLMWDSGRLSAGLFYNLRGDSLKSGAAVGDTGATPDIYLTRQESLNLTLAHQITPSFTVRLRISNLTEESVTEVYRMAGVPDEVRRRYAEGVETSFSASYAF